MGYPLDPEQAVDVIARDVDRHSKTHGFQEEWLLARRLEDMADRIAAVPVQIEDAQILRQAAKALRVNFLGMKIALMHSELSEALERLREVGVDEVTAGDEHFIEELADSVIRVMETSQILGRVSLGEQIVSKVKRNQARPHLHGKQH